MYFKSLTLSGFKSFGKTTVLEFPTPIAAIVGPNGSGKSNVVEAIRWVLGEQSMKSLRGKKGEDLIFGGSEKSARLGRAEVKLIFDNSGKQFPFDFDDIVISRRVMRDGTNEYVLNGSVVRLKDIFELLSKVGLGSTQHHIISQGEVDRILWASPSERQEMIEEALGLKEYHIKQRDAERKLNETEANRNQVEAQRREIKPHLKYLRLQADKMKDHEEFKNKLVSQLHSYASKEFASLEVMREASHKTKDPILEEKTIKEGKIRSIQKEIESAEKQYAGIKKGEDISRLLEELNEKHKNLTRELGRVEGQLASASTQDNSGVSVQVLLRNIREIVAIVDELMQKDSFESLKAGLKDIKVKLEESIKISGNGGGGDSQLLVRKDKLIGELRAIEDSLSSIENKRKEDQMIREDVVIELRERETELREQERELDLIRERLRNIEYSEEKYKLRLKEWDAFMRDNTVSQESLDKDADPFGDDAERFSLHRTIERLRIKLEEAGGIDESVVQEFDETQKRDLFLEGELGDLEKAEKSLRGLMKELEEKLEDEFTQGLRKINTEFQNLFKKIFGGGKASLAYVVSKPESEDEEVKSGIEITLDIPRKRLRSLDMLSGGERALTSVALLFAMSIVNPPPFLVLDETDAALDEANSQRYGDLLKDLAGKTQLVVITHNRQTMQRAGVLYGVTMGGDGISKILSLKFDEAKELAGVDN